MSETVTGAVLVALPILFNVGFRRIREPGVALCRRKSVRREYM
jgi:hypothetical protein